MAVYSVTLAAQTDIEKIIEDIASERPSAAERFEEKLYAAFDLLAQHPESGTHAPI